MHSNDGGRAFPHHSEVVETRPGAEPAHGHHMLMMGEVMPRTLTRSRHANDGGKVFPHHSGVMGTRRGAAAPCKAHANDGGRVIPHHSDGVDRMDHVLMMRGIMPSTFRTSKHANDGGRAFPHH